MTKNKNTNSLSLKSRQRGVVLVISLVVLLLVTVIGTAGIRTSSLGMLISANEEERVLAFQTAQAAADEIAEDADNFVVAGVPGVVTKCTANGGCGDATLSFTSAALSAVDDAEIERSYPERSNPPRLVDPSSARTFEATYFRVNVNYDLENHGRAEVAQGFMRVINNSKVN